MNSEPAMQVTTSLDVVNTGRGNYWSSNAEGQVGRQVEKPVIDTDREVWGLQQAQAQPQGDIRRRSRNKEL